MTPTKVAITPEEHKQIIKEEIQKADIFPHKIPEIKQSVGKCILMKPRTHVLYHEAVPMLNTYSKGCPVDCGPDWSCEQIMLLLRRGPHKSANSKEAINQLREETINKVNHGVAKIVKWVNIKNKIPPRLKILPVAMILHKSKKFRCILDLTFKLKHEGKIFTSINKTTVKQALPQSMVQLGQSVKRIVATMANNHNKTNPFIFSKLDIKDGFWRMAVSNADAWNFTYILPSCNKNIQVDDIELVIPNSLQMGWCESPPPFCSGTEAA